MFHENNPKTMAKDDNKPADSIEVENEFIKDLSEQKGEKSNLDAKHELEKTNQNLSSPYSELNVDVKIADITVQEEVILPFVSRYYYLSNFKSIYQCRQ